MSVLNFEVVQNDLVGFDQNIEKRNFLKSLCAKPNEN